MSVAVALMYLQILINGVLLGCMYGIAAMGLSLIFGSMQIMFITQGAVTILASCCIYNQHRRLFIDGYHQ
jgi:branched-chain amino acid transport system permease protein